MSVICQNFVQNAWKKDLCSNCFKSVGDHDNSILLHDPQDDLHHHHSLNDNHLKTMAQSHTTVFQTQSTPHTTWKTLISEKNAKNGASQPFKLETGFQGRLLTINKATNGVVEKKNETVGKKSNGQLTSFSRSASSDDLLNGHSKTNGFHQHASTNGGHHPILQNGTKTTPEGTIKQAFKPKENGSTTPTRVKSPELQQHGERKTLVKSKSDDYPSAAPHSILKKTVSTPTSQSNPSPRRGSNVGFKDEEPLVIGYGGRDFSPEELEWDMNVSDIDHGSDSLDETEDDRAFSKMTRQNTEFNSDNSNLLKMNQPPMGKEAGGKMEEAEASVIPKGNEDDQDNKGRPEKKGVDVKDEFDSQAEDPMMSNQSDSGAAIYDNERSVSERGDKGGCVDAPPADQNSPGTEEGAPRQSDLEMFADGEERVGEERRNANTLPGENNEEWQEREEDGVAGQILQAINTSLTNRHKMNEPVDPGEAAKTAELPVVKVVVSSSDEEASLVEPRASFLHGRPKTKPSAIYGPASDLFVTRSDSSSSSSSDEFKSEVPRSVNVVIKGGSPSDGRHDDEDAEKPKTTQLSSIQENGTCLTTNKPKPEIPAKPAKPLAKFQKKFVAKTKPATERRDSDSSDTLQNGYYSVGNATYSDGPKSISLVDHYAESNIYHEVGDLEMKLPDNNTSDKAIPRESKLAALAMELEQVRHCNGNTKRQAPAPPPKVPEPPLEDPPNSMGRSSPISLDSPQGFSTYRGEAMAFSSSSSTASTSSQDTEAGYASWNIHGDLDEHRKNGKSKSSFLLTQYSKCKMLAMGYAEDSAKSRKKFSLKKLLKIQKKESEAPPPGFDSNGPNPKAWKYSDHFERPRAKLEIIHPMDLENRNVTVNPGFDSLHSGSMSSFAASADDLSLRNSVSSDYGSFYSDAVSPIHDSKPEVNYECIPQQNSMEEQEEQNEVTERGGSNSPTPSRASTVSQASTLTSGSSKNGGGSPLRPPKPPPPPRAHSLLPGSKALNPDGTFKFPVPNGIAVNSSDSVTTPPTKPQAPKRQCKQSSPPKTDCGIYDNTVVDTSPTTVEQVNEEMTSEENAISADENPYGTILEVQASNLEKSLPEISENAKVQSEVADSAQSNSQPTVQEVRVEPQAINISVKVKPVSEPIEKVSKNAITRNRNSPVTKAPARPPPIYMKSQISGIVKNPNPWKTLEDSYLVLTASNRELLVKLVNQALKKRKNFVSKLQKIEFQWSDFEIDMEQPSAVFAFGEKIAYHATMPNYPEYAITLVVTVQQQHDRMNENGFLKYPVFGHFVDYIPKELLDENYASDAELESMQATILVLDHSNISTIECFSESLPSSLTEEQEKELCFIILQLIQSLKSLQAHGIESIDPSFQNLVLAKTRNDQYNSLVFLSDGCFDDESDYVSDSCCNKISLCQYTLMLLFQMLGIQSAEEFFLPPPDKFSSETSRRVFETAVSLLSEEKAVSLSQTKTLFECFLWGVTGIIKKIDDSDDVDSVLQRWLDIKRSGYIKTLIDDDGLCDINVQSEYFSQFLIRTSVRNIKEVVSYL